MSAVSPHRFAAALLSLILILPPLQADLLITEFLALNDSSLQDEDGAESDWIEISNTGTSAVNLDGWYLTDDKDDPDKWRFPAVVIAAGDELIVFASDKNRQDPGAELHANFKLSSGGEYLALVQADGSTVEHAYDPVFPPQYPDVSYGLALPGEQTVAVVGAGAAATCLVPTGDGDDVNNPAASPPWNDPGFDDTSWTATPLGVGFSTNQTNYDPFIGTNGDVEALMHDSVASAYIRVPFTLDDPAEVQSLTLWMRYDDGFAAYINGGAATVAGANNPADGALAWNSVASDGHPDSEAVDLVPFAIDLADVTLVAGLNLLGIHGLNRAADNSDFLADCELEAVVVPAGGVPEPVYMTTMTPGAPNAGGVADLGPVFRQVTESAPLLGLPGDTGIVVTAEVEETAESLSAVTVHHRWMFGAESSLPMLDDGVAPDLVADDGVFSATVPVGSLAAGEMIRWRFEAEDSVGTVSRAPLFNDPVNSAEYYGTIADDPSITSELPVVHWFVEDEAAADTRTGTRASAWFGDEFYDNFLVRIRGGSTAGFPKRSYKFDFNTREHFRFDPLAGRAEEINLNQTWSDKAYIRQPLSFEVYDRCGAPGSESFLVRLRRNGQFHAISAFIEQPDERLLKREVLDDDGALYKMFNKFTSGTSGVEKKNRRHEDNSDLSAFVAAINGGSGTVLEAEIFDRVDVPRQLNYLVGTVLTQNNDNMAKNYYLYRDSDGTGEWFQIPWDTDLTWGSHYMTGDSSADDGIWATADYVLGGRNQDAPISPSHPFTGTEELPANRSWNRLIDKLHENPRFAEMFRRRLRTVMDETFAAPVLDDRIAEMVAQFTPDAEEDRLKWGQFGQSQTLSQAIGILEDDYLAPRRPHLFVTHLDANAGSYPTPQTSSALLPSAQGSLQVDFGNHDPNPASGNQGDEFVELVNPNGFAVDLSGWTIQGGVSQGLLAGTVIEAGGSLYLSPSVPEFRARATSPTGGEGNFVQGDYDGQISSRGEVILLVNGVGTTVATLVTPVDPSDAQLYLRITEIHYAPPGGTSYEFIELKNTGPVMLDLAGVHFTQGVEFTFGAGVSLAPGEVGILVREPAHFPTANILGVYTGGLQNDGEQITLRDAVGENVLSFGYDGNWLSPALSGGYTIGIVDDTAPWDSWDLAASWALSSEVGGSPGLENPADHSLVFEGWQRGYFSEAQIADPLVGGPDADASGDGISNLMKYALGLDPTVNSRSGLPELELTGQGPEYSFRRQRKAVDLGYRVESSRDLGAWAEVTTQVGDPVDQGGGIDLVTMGGEAFPTSMREFFRLVVTRQ